MTRTSKKVWWKKDVERNISKSDWNKNVDKVEKDAKPTKISLVKIERGSTHELIEEQIRFNVLNQYQKVIEIHTRKTKHEHNAMMQINSESSVKQEQVSKVDDPVPVLEQMKDGIDKFHSKMTQMKFGRK